MHAIYGLKHQRKAMRTKTVYDKQINPNCMHMTAH